MTVRHIKADDFDELEKTAAQIPQRIRGFAACNKISIAEDELSQILSCFLGLYANKDDIEKFKIERGERILLLQVAQYTNSQLAKASPDEEDFSIFNTELNDTIGNSTKDTAVGRLYQNNVASAPANSTTGNFSYNYFTV